MYEPTSVEQVTPGAAENAMFGTSVPAALTRMIPLNVITLFVAVEVVLIAPPATELKIEVNAPEVPAFKAAGAPDTTDQVQFVIVAFVRTKLIVVVCVVTVPVVIRY